MVMLYFHTKYGNGFCTKLPLQIPLVSQGSEELIALAHHLLKTSPNSSDQDQENFNNFREMVHIVVDLGDLVKSCIEDNLVYFSEEKRHSKGRQAV